MRRLAHAFLLLLLSFSAAADDGTELQNLYTALNMLNQQQQAIYQQFQMVQELRRSSGGPPSLYGGPLYSQGQVMDYEEAVAAQKNAIRREEDLYRQAGELLARYNEIEEQKKPLQSRIYELSLEK